MDVFGVDTKPLIDQLAQIGDQSSSSIDRGSRSFQHDHFATRRDANSHPLFNSLEMAIMAPEETSRIRPLLELYLESGRDVQSWKGVPSTDSPERAEE